MLRFTILTLAVAWFAGAQETDDDTYHPHAAFAFIRTGDRTPLLQDGTPVLTALGAQQMGQLGQGLRARYISGTGPAGFGAQRIAGMSRDTLINDQIMVQTSSEQYLIASAQAFMQGLYPPHNIASGNGTVAKSTSLLSNGSAVDFPMGGYQYASVQTAGELDPESIYVAGSASCPTTQRDSMTYYTTNEFKDTRAATKDFYSKLDKNWVGGYLNQSAMDYINAMSIYEYMQYQYTHNRQIYQNLANDSAYAGVYDKARSLADQQAWTLYGNKSSFSTDASNQAIAGRTLAATILGSLQKVIADRSSPGNPTDMSYPLTFFFGEQEPMIALLSTIMVDRMDPYFRSIPVFGSALIFELFSTGSNSSFPSTKDDLWVRFLYHNGTTAADSSNAKQLIAHPMFGNGPSRTDMPYREFEDLFSRVMVSNVADWCKACNSASIFCLGLSGSGYPLTSPTSKQGAHHAVTPVVGGVIGAIVTLVVAALLFALAMLIGGVRLHRKPRTERGSALGGFKGSAKLASDPDLSLTKNGALPAGISFVPEAKRGHERVGSWELRQKEFGARERDSLDGIDAVAARPVVAEERV
ncbi:histidine phosphatase superfamily [Phaeosphaeria sp. MPI-PUGE-AT-0046c]|nr:histidine phosphatase superfamily [Phaeosphaeria sp. MPI-PUGE-AT-0046c]